MTQPNHITSARKALSVCALTFTLCLPATAALFTFSGPFADTGAGPGVIRDYSSIGLTDWHDITGLGSSISDVVLTVNLSGNYISDLSGYIRLGNTQSSPSVSLNSYLDANNTTFSVHLTSFQGLNPNNTWTLFFADTSSGGQNSLAGWSLNITAVPEPVTVALAIFGVIGLGVGSTRWYLGRRRLHRRPLAWPGL